MWHYEQWHTANAVRPYATLTFQGWLVVTFKQRAGGRPALSYPRVHRGSGDLVDGAVWLALWGFYDGGNHRTIVAFLRWVLKRSRGESHFVVLLVQQNRMGWGIMELRRCNSCSAFERWILTTHLRWGCFNIACYRNVLVIQLTGHAYVCACVLKIDATSLMDAHSIQCIHLLIKCH